MDNPVIIVLVIALVAAIGAAIWLFMRNRQTAALQDRFGPEYDRALEALCRRVETQRFLDGRRN